MTGIQNICFINPILGKQKWSKHAWRLCMVFIVQMMWPFCVKVADFWARGCSIGSSWHWAHKTKVLFSRSPHMFEARPKRCALLVCGLRVGLETHSTDWWETQTKHANVHFPSWETLAYMWKCIPPTEIQAHIQMMSSPSKRNLTIYAKMQKPPGT